MRPGIESMSFYVANGTATAKMSRGSFRHRDRVRNMRRLTALSVTRGDGVETVSLRDPFTGRGCSASITPCSVPDGTACAISRLHADVEGLGTNRLIIELPSSPHERFYGCGETFSEFDLKGHKATIWVAEHQNAARIAEKMVREKLTGRRPDYKQRFDKYESYFVQPTFVSDRGYFVHIDGNFFMEFDFRASHRVKLTLRGNADIYFGEAGSWEGLSQGLSVLMGRQPRIPDYLTEGIVLASQRGTASVEKKIREARAADLPLTGFWCQDWCGCRETDFGYQVMWNWQADESLYPDLKARIAGWEAEGIRFFGYINPFMAVEGPLYAEATAKGYCVKDPAGNDYMVTITTFPAAMIDLTNPEAVRWYKDIIRDNLIGIGMSGWMADFGEYLPTDAVLYSGEDPAEKHNEWPAMWARLNREIIDECGVSDEVFFFVRAGYSGTIANAPLVWNGDQHTDWSADHGIPSVIPATMSLALSGVGVCHSDIGGYTSIMHMKRSKELLMRWAEMNCFSPVMRMHEGNRPDTNTQFDADEELLAHVALMGRLHRALGGYIRDTLEEYYDRGIPAMRPVFYNYGGAPGKAAAGGRDLGGMDDEYLLGRDILVAPVLRDKSRSRDCVIPEGEWVHLFTGRVYGPGRRSVAAPIGMPPAFVRKGSAREKEILEAFAGICRGEDR